MGSFDFYNSAHQHKNEWTYGHTHIEIQYYSTDYECRVIDSAADGMFQSVGYDQPSDGY